MRRDPEPSPSRVSHTLSPSLCLYSCHLVGKAGGRGPYQDNGQLDCFLRAIKIIGANANTGGQPEEQGPSMKLKPNLTPVIFHLPLGLG